MKSYKKREENATTVAKKQRIVKRKNKNYQKLISLKIFRLEFGKLTPKRHKKMEEHHCRQFEGKFK